MKQVAQNYKSGELTVLDCPAPACRPGGVLVRSLFSLISTGTELMKVSEASMSMVGMARARPDQVRKVLDQARQQGVRATYKKVMNRLDSYTPLGYSLSGVVTEVGPGATEFEPGQLVAAAGNEHALHAEYNWVPVNLCAPVPPGVAPEHAAFATVASIAMHGVRRGQVQLGETSVVIGLGLVGQLVVRLLLAAGAQVVGIDPIAERCALATKAGAVLCGAPGDDQIPSGLAGLTAGRGADHVFLAAGGSSNEPTQLAIELARDRGRVIDIGKTRLNLPWNACYNKELEVLFSRSYGPGRYDDSYELDGIDYPAGYVRWTERRNLACFLDLLARNQLEVGTLIDDVFPVADAPRVYGELKSGAIKAVGVLLSYPPAPGGECDGLRSRARTPSRSPTAGGSKRRRVALGFIGAGNYACTMLLPHLARMEEVELAQVVTNTSLSAANAQHKFGFTEAATSAQDVLTDDSLDAIFIVTRHATHADLVCRALRTGKAVFVEKPLALSRDQVAAVAETVAETGNNRLMVGFNRRFAPLLIAMRESFGTAAPVSVARYLINAGKLAPDSWYLNQTAEGSRFAGEGGHFIDMLSWWTDGLPVQVHAAPGTDPDDALVTVRFDTGSAATIAYLAGGNVRYPKETIDFTGGGRSGRFDNFTSATIWSGRNSSTTRSRGGPDKGQRAQLRAFIDAVRGGDPMPIGLDSLLATTSATIAVQESLASGDTVRVAL